MFENEVIDPNPFKLYVILRGETLMTWGLKKQLATPVSHGWVGVQWHLPTLIFTASHFPCFFLLIKCHRNQSRPTKII